MAHSHAALLRVSIYRQGELVGREVFRERHIVIGRDPTMADLVIGSVQVSREHALLEHDGQHVFLHDLESTNGIYVNGERVRSAKVSARDRVFVGEHLLRLELRIKRPHERKLSTTGTFVLGPDGVPTLSTDAQMQRIPTQIMTLPLAEPGEVAWSQAVPPAEDASDAIIEEEDNLSAALVLGDAVVLPESEKTPMCVAVCKTRGQQVIDFALVSPHHPYRAADPHRRERWGLSEKREAPLEVRLHNSTCAVGFPVGQHWSVRRAGEAVSESTGVREGWVRRRRGMIHLSLKRGELLLVETGAMTYHVRFVPQPRAFKRRPRVRLPRNPVVLWAGVLSLLLHGWMMAGMGLWSPPRWAPQWRPPTVAGPVDIRVAPAPGQVVRSATPLTVPPSFALAPSPRVPGGTKGFALLGLPDVDPTPDPMIPAPAGPLNLKRAAAFLRGKPMGFGSLIPSGVGPSWHLTIDPAHPPALTPAGQVEVATVLAQVEHSAEAVATCYAHHTPADAGLTARVDLTFSIAATGAVSNIEPTVAAVSDDLLTCMRQAMGRWRLPKRAKTAPAVAGSYVFVFKRVGFD